MPYIGTNEMENIMNSEEIVEQVLQNVAHFNIDDIPNIDLYMDQVTTYLSDKFKAAKRHEDDKLMTKTMINNYAKSRLLPSPEKKKYTKDHLMVLIMIYFYKNILSINDVTKLLSPLLDKHFHNEDMPLETIINTFLDYTHKCDLPNLITREAEESIKIFDHMEIDDKDYIQTLGLISLLSYDIFVKKMLIEKLIDSLPDSTSVEKDKEKDKEKKSKEKDKSKDKSKSEKKSEENSDNK